MDRLFNQSGNTDIWITKQINALIKPCCFIVIPENYQYINQNKDELVRMIEELYNSYEIPIERIVRDDEFTTEDGDDAERITDIDKGEGREREDDLIHKIRDLITARVQGLATMSEDELNYYLDLLTRA